MKRKILFFVLTVIMAVLLLVSCGEKSDFTYENNKDGEIVITGYNGENMNVIIPDTIGGKTVTAIGKGAFDATLIESIELPESVVEIGKYAFRRCGKLNKVVIKGEIDVIPEGAFNYCLALSQIDIPDTVEVIENNAFGMTGLLKIKLPDSVKTVGDYAFFNCIQLTDFESGTGLESIGNNVFGGCISLCSVQLNEGLTYLGEYAFSSCTALPTFSLPTTLQTLEMGVFSGTSFESYVVPSGIKTINTYAFAGCKNLKEIYIPQSVEKMNVDVFKDCKGFVIYGVSYSEADVFAATYGYDFKVYKFE